MAVAVGEREGPDDGAEGRWTLVRRVAVEHVGVPGL